MAAYDAPTRASVSSLSGAVGLQTLLLRIYDHQRHMFEWAREKRPDVGCVAPSLIQVAAVSGTREFNIYDFLKFTHTGAGLTAQGCINDICDAHQIHPHMHQDYIVNPWTGSVPAASNISPYHYWTAASQVRVWRAASALPDNTRPLLSTETGQSYDSDGVVTTGRTDVFQLRRLKLGLLVLGPLYYGCCQVNFFSIARSPVTGYNTIDVNTGLYYGDAAPERDADYAFASLDQRETSDDISFPTKTWTGYWKDWQVWFDQQQNPIDGGPTVCPFAEWNRVTMSASSVTMTAGARNLLARKKNLRRGSHVFSADVKLSAAGSQACLRVSGHDKLNGLALVSSTILSGVQDWTRLSVTFVPRQHGNRRIPDPAVAVLLVDHNGTGTCEVRNPTIVMGGEGAVVPPPTYFDFQAMDVAWTPTSPAQGQTVTFNVTIKNVGDAPSPSGTILGVAFNVDGVLSTWSDNITAGMAIGETRVQTANGGPTGTATWTAVGGQHTVAAIVDNVNRFPTEKLKTNNTVSKTITVSIPTGPQVPPAAAGAGLNTLYFNDDFTSLNFYHTVTKPDGIWRFNEFWQDSDQAGFMDFAAARTFMVNQMISGAGGGTHPTWTDATAKATVTPYFPASQLDSTTMRLTCRRARMSTRPTLRALINDIAVVNQQQQPDLCTWLGAYMTTEVRHPFAPADISRPAYIEIRMRFLPANTQGIFSSFWIFDTSEVGTDPALAPEIDIFESNDLNPTFWATNIHQTQSTNIPLRHEGDWGDGNFHTIGMLWESSSLKIYYDDVVSNQLTGAQASFFNVPMRIILTHTCDPGYGEVLGILVPPAIENIYWDVDYIRVWTLGGGGGGTGTSILMANRGHMANTGQSGGTNRNVVYRTAFMSSKRASITQVRVVFSNSYLDATGEHIGLNTIYVTAAVEYGGVSRPLTFSGGSREVTMAPGAVVVSDLTTISIPAATQFWTRQNVRTANATEKYAVGYTSLTVFGEGYSITTPLAQVDTTGVLSGNSAFGVFAPVSVMGLGDVVGAPSVVIVGSSTAFGNGENFAGITAPGDRGFLSRMISNNMGQTVIAAASNTLSQWQSASAERMEIINTIQPTHIICAFGANDILAGESAATVQSRMQSIWTQLSATGAKIIQMTIQPLTTSTDAWVTTANQTLISGISTVAATVNTYIRTVPSPVFDVIDYCAVVESTANSGKWRVNGGAWTTDGIHTTRHAEIATALDGDYQRIWGTGGGGGGNTILTTGNPAEDLWDDLIIQYCAQYGHPNPRIVKAQVKWESDQIFDVYCISSDTPCGIFSGWTSLESRSFGLLQVTPACGESGGGRMLLANGHPNVTVDTGAALWPGSVYNPELNLDAGIGAITGGYDYFKAQFPTCSEYNLVLMAAAGYVGDWSDITGCGQWTNQNQINYIANIERIYDEWWGSTGSTAYDLVVDSISMSPASPVGGQAVTFSATIRNAGTAATPTATIHGIAFTVDGNGSTKTWSDNVTSSLQPGQSRTQSANGGVTTATWLATAGSHTVIADVDDANRMPNEISNTNNTLTLTFTVGTGSQPGIPLGKAAVYVSPNDSNQQDLITVMDLTGVTQFSFAFVTSNASNQPVWAGFAALNDAAWINQINAVRANGGDVIPSIGGATSTPLEDRISTAAALAAAYQQVINVASFTAIDIDFESTGFYAASNTIRHRVVDALKIIQTNNPTVLIYITTSLPIESAHTDIINYAASVGLNVTGWTGMPFDWSSHTGTMAQATIVATDALKNLVQSAYGYTSAVAYQHVGISSMCGLTDTAEVVTLADFNAMKDYAVLHNIARFTFWQLNRDRSCDATNVSPNECSDLTQQPLDFTRVVAAYS